MATFEVQVRSTQIQHVKHVKQALVFASQESGCTQAALRIGGAAGGLVRDLNYAKVSEISMLIPELKFIQGDLRDSSSLRTALDQTGPQEIYNLGAMSFVGESWDKAALTTEVSAVGVLNLLEAIRLYAGSDISSAKFYQASSSEMYGAAAASPQDETTAFWPRSPYGVAKVFGHHMTINYRESYGLHA
mgnify:CR=1 FL=1